MGCWTRANEWVALRLGGFLGSMYAFWVFNLIALLPFIWPASLSIAQYVSSGYLQLVALPLLAVVTVLTGRGAEARAQADHEAIMGEVETLRAIQSSQNQILSELHARGESSVCDTGVPGI